METLILNLQDRITTLHIKEDRLEDKIETITKKLKETRNRLWEISNAMEEGIDECMDAESCWARACAIADGEDTYSTMSPFDDEKSVDEF